MIGERYVWEEGFAVPVTNASDGSKDTLIISRGKSDQWACRFHNNVELGIQPLNPEVTQPLVDLMAGKEVEINGVRYRKA
jgi:hypothetical protein